MQTVDDFIAETQRCRTLSDLKSVFQRSMQDEGYENTDFFRLQNRRVLETIWTVVPETYCETYKGLDLETHDPVFRWLQQVRTPIYWSDVNSCPGFSPEEKRVIEICRGCGVHSGVTIPFAGPDSLCDIIDVSMRQNNSVDRARLPVIQAKAYQVWNRYWQMKNELLPATPIHDMIHFSGPKGMTAAHCRSLVMVDVAARRYEMDLPDLNLNIFNLAGEKELSELLTWGLVSEHSDEENFVFYFAPTALGAVHLRNCTQAKEFRRVVWAMDVLRKEVPVT